MTLNYKKHYYRQRPEENIEEILDDVDRIAENNAAAKAAVDIALHDLVGKLLGQPWYRIWGLSPEKTPSTFYTIGIDTPEKVIEKTKEAPAFPILKVKVGIVAALCQCCRYE